MPRRLPWVSLRSDAQCSEDVRWPMRSRAGLSTPTRQSRLARFSLSRSEVQQRSWMTISSPACVPCLNFPQTTSEPSCSTHSCREETGGALRIGTSWPQTACLFLAHELQPLARFVWEKMVADRVFAQLQTDGSREAIEGFRIKLAELDLSAAKPSQ